MQWINTRSDVINVGLRQSMIEVYGLPSDPIRGNHWMNLDNGDTLWMIYDHIVYRFFRHFPATGTVVEVTDAIAGGHTQRVREKYDAAGYEKQWETFIDELLDATGLPELSCRRHPPMSFY